VRNREYMKMRYFLSLILFTIYSLAPATPQLHSLPNYGEAYWMRITPKGTLGKNTFFIVLQIIRNLDSFFAKKITPASKKQIKTISGKSNKSMRDFVLSSIITPQQRAKHQRGTTAMMNYLLTTKTIQDDIKQAKSTLDTLKDHLGKPVPLSDEEKDFFVSFFITNFIRNNTDYITEKYGPRAATIDDIRILTLLSHAFFEKIIQITLSSTVDKNTKKYLLALVLFIQKIGRSNAQPEQKKALVAHIAKGFSFLPNFLTYLEQYSEIEPAITQKIITQKKRMIALLQKIISQHEPFKNVFTSKKKIGDILPVNIGLPGLIRHIKAKQ